VEPSSARVGVGTGCGFVFENRIGPSEFTFENRALPLEFKFVNI
jgi:hypothetical protein